MSLYRTWRPRTFADLVGQDAVVRTLTTALSTGRLAHAYLFSGPRGSGKTSAAKILARCIECVNGPTATPDNTCDNCRAILEGSALDVVEIDAASNRGIDEIRALRDAVKFAPASMRSKVYIVDEAHMLTKEGANAFLKTLEEPPPHAVFILATTAPEALPPTILSRCQRYAFRRIAIPVMISRMREIAEAEKIEIDTAALGAIAYRADGGLRDALTMLEQVAAFAGGAIDAATVDAAFGVTGREYARALVDAILGSDAAAALRIVDDASDAGTEMTGLIRSLAAEIRHLLVARVNPELLARDLAADDAAVARERSAAFSQPRAIRALRLLSEATSGTRTSGNPRLELESALLRLILSHEDPSLEALSARVAALESGEPGTAGPVPRPPATRTEPAARAATPPSPPSPSAAPPRPIVLAPSPAPAARTLPTVARRQPPDPDETGTAVTNDAPLTLQKLASLWANVKTRIESERPSLGGVLTRTTVANVQDGAVTLFVGDTKNADLLRGAHSLVERALSDVVGSPLRVTISTSAAPSPIRQQGAATGESESEFDLMNYALKRLQ